MVIFQLSWPTAAVFPLSPPPLSLFVHSLHRLCQNHPFNRTTQHIVLSTKLLLTAARPHQPVMDPVPDPQPIPGPAPQPDIALPLAIVAPAADEKKEKHDGFYKSWDRFTKKKRLLSITASLDHDAEGRPGHGVRRNTEGVVSRYALCLALT